MKQAIESFIQSKKVSVNSQKSYTYDLQQFVTVTKGEISQQSLLVYQQSLLDLKPAAQKRKMSAVNQFLYFLYENNLLDRFYKLQTMSEPASVKKKLEREDLTLLFQESPWLDGQLIALLIALLGLTPSEIAELTSQQVNLDFQVLTVEKGATKRVLSLPKELIPYMEPHLSGSYVFDKKGQTYSRQWFFNRLTEFVQSIGKPDWTAQKLREQYILKQIDEGKTLDQIAKQLGLKTSMSLEKFR
ncbi:TPA: site-specific tyrosine recombinase XerD [Streptococcus suis]|uniref:site-specific tyrosine recombinase XerD n=1 Tax=Streptococcus suis TaxID=1307 RepID=UPI00211C79CF|nr:site-specific tyrosine recombinase XerD [Streptococcus suis]MCQ9277038.1 site-specific tyrosine recombinase XerD [Streptococcus suis]HEM2786294.1 site-specific tyrosine recombinase XerD [Streptococcus suis]HEM6035629.1 site-specific tyrosine recombinase XerD [Streptococcus suis]HEM6052767.1 site-specific tyrosine recombinase XerD [Streptococcus suis]HEM6097080.1 site-specific tyrosine recombinase XerD [Streptococcus suis]